MGRKKSNKTDTRFWYTYCHIVRKSPIYTLKLRIYPEELAKVFCLVHSFGAARRWICIKMSYITTQGQEVSDFLHALDPTKATGIDGLGPRTHKMARSSTKAFKLLRSHLILRQQTYFQYIVYINTPDRGQSKR